MKNIEEFSGKSSEEWSSRQNKKSKTHKRLKERFLIGQNRTQHAHKTEKQTNKNNKKNQKKTG